MSSSHTSSSTTAPSSSWPPKRYMRAELVSHAAVWPERAEGLGPVLGTSTRIQSGPDPATVDVRTHASSRRQVAPQAPPKTRIESSPAHTPEWRKRARGSWRFAEIVPESSAQPASGSQRQASLNRMPPPPSPPKTTRPPIELHHAAEWPERGAGNAGSSSGGSESCSQGSEGRFLPLTATRRTTRRPRCDMARPEWALKR
mmetsp:Transcript_16303/g.47526  ORF Transcript_16303/g.47526 Transcript_16303/m.47526 type:complete len:201 (-) Transcript_16303:47-649(-)